MSKQGRVIRNILALLVSQAGTWTVTLVLTLVIPPYLGASLYGLYAFALTYAGFFALGMSLGMGTYLTWRIARDPGHAARLTFNTLMLQIPLGLIFGSLAVALLPLMDHDRIAIILVSIVTASVVISTLSGTCIAALAGFQIMRVPSFISVGTSAFSAILAIVVVHMHGTVIMLAGAVLAAQTVNLIIMLVYAQRILHMRPQIEFRLWPRLVGGGLPFFMWSAVLLFYWQIDVIMLKAMVGDSVIGWYSAANRIISIPSFLPSIVAMALMPALAHERSADSPYFRDLASRAIRLILAMNIPASAGIILLSGSMLQILHYPAGFAPVVPLVVILAINMPWVALDMVLGTVLIAVGRQRAWTLVGVVAGMLNPIVNLWAIPYTQHVFGNGAIGAALTTIQSEIIMFTGAMLLRPRGVFTRWDIFYIFRTLIATGIMVPAVWMFNLLGIGVIPAVAYGLVIYVCAAYALKLVRDEDITFILAGVLGKLGNEGLARMSARELLHHAVQIILSSGIVRQAQAFINLIAWMVMPLAAGTRLMGRAIWSTWSVLTAPATTRLRASSIPLRLQQVRAIFDDAEFMDEARTDPDWSQPEREAATPERTLAAAGIGASDVSEDAYSVDTSPLEVPQFMAGNT